MKTAIRDNDPCIVFVDGNLGGLKGDVPENNEIENGELLIPFGSARVVKEGADCTVVGIVNSNVHALSASENWKRRDINRNY